MVDNIQEYGKIYAHTAATSVIGHMITQEKLSAEEILECVRFTLKILNTLVKDESIPWQTTKAMFMEGAKRKVRKNK